MSSACFSGDVVALSGFVISDPWLPPHSSRISRVSDSSLSTEPDEPLPLLRLMIESLVTSPPEPPVPPDPPPVPSHKRYTSIALHPHIHTLLLRINLHCFSLSPPEPPTTTGYSLLICSHRTAVHISLRSRPFNIHLVCNSTSVFNFSNLGSLPAVAAKSGHQPSRPPASSHARYGNSDVGASPPTLHKRRNPNVSWHWVFMDLGLHLLKSHTEIRPIKPNKFPQPNQSSSTKQSAATLMASSTTGLSFGDVSLMGIHQLETPSSTNPANPITDLLVSGFGDVPRSSTPLLWKTYTAIVIVDVIEDSASMASRVQMFDHLSPMVTNLDQALASYAELKIEVSWNLPMATIYSSFCLCFLLVLSLYTVISISLAKSLDFSCTIVLRD